MGRAICVLLLALLACAHPAAALALSMDDARHAFKLTNPPDPPPPFDPRDYERFAQRGTGTLVAQMATLLKSGQAIFVAYGEPVFLYPLTRYTNWILSRWANTEVAGIAWNVQPTYPGQRFNGDPHPSGLSVPAILIPPLFKDDPPTAVRRAYRERGLDLSGVVTFRSVPAGDYVLVARTSLEYSVDEAEPDPVRYELGPDGMLEPDPTSAGVRYEQHTLTAGGFLVVNRVTVSNGKTTYAPAVNCNAVAYYP
jgi:hypothetical protein